jgi:hypothetical protein
MSDTMNGVRSSMPIGGMIRRRGENSGSVTSMSTR